MKKVMLLLVLVLSLTITGCSSGEDNEQQESNQEATGEETAKAEEQEEVPIDPDEIKLDVKLLEPDSIDNVYAEATFTNNSEYTIIEYDATMLSKDSNEKSYLESYDTVMPGETSPTFQAMGPKTQKNEDYEMLKLDLVAQLENGNELHINYDFKLKEAEWGEFE